MAYLDIIIIIPLIWATYKGFTKGLVQQLATLIALILGIFTAVKLSSIAGQYLVSRWGYEPRISHLISFVIIFIAILILVFLISKLIERLLEAASLNIFNKLAGVLFSLLKYILIVSVILNLIELTDSKLHFIKPADKEKSLLYQPVLKAAPVLYPYLQFNRIKEIIPEDTKK